MSARPLDVDAFFAELEAWADRRSSPTERRAYGPLPDQHAVLRTPPDGGPRPVAVVLHGGFWRARFAQDIMAAFCAALAERGLATWNVEYRRVGAGGGYPETLEDVAAACRQLRPAVAIGHSAGAQLALWAAAEGLVPSAVSLAGVCDLVAAANEHLGDDAVRELMGAPPADAPAVYAHADPMQRLPFAARVLLVHGTEDDRVPIAQSRSFARAAGCELVELEGAGHFDLVDPRSPFWPRVAAAIS
jgi:acetyl esterase/lipase